MPSKSIKRKIVRTTVLITIIMTMIISIVLALFLRQQARKDQDSYLLERAENVADRIEIFIDENTLMVEGLANNEILKNWIMNSTADNTEISDWLKSINPEKRYSAVYVLDKDGKGIAATDPSFMNQDYSFRRYFKESKLGKSSFEAGVGITSRLPGYFFSAPIKDNAGNIVGILVLKLTPSYLNDVMLKRSIDKDEKIMLSDNNGVIVYSNIEDRVYHSFGSFSLGTAKKTASEEAYLDIKIEGLQYPQVQSLIEQNTTIPELISLFDAVERTDETLAVVPITRYGLFLVIESEINNLVVLTAAVGNIGALLLLSALLIIIVLLIINRFLKPLAQLKIMAGNISQGDFDQKNLVENQDELGDLGEIIEDMGKKLKNSYSDLEQGVSAKTIELQEKAQSLENVKKAILNILEDVKAEKDKSTNLAKDLEKFKLALDNSSDSIVMADRNKKLIYVNSGTTGITGYAPQEILGTEAGEIWGQSVDNIYREKIWKTVGKEKKVFSGVIKSHRKNGEEFDAQISIYPLTDEKEDIEFLVCIERDITKEKQIDKAKTEFVSLASHQLKTPLSSINWYTEMLLAGDAGKLNKEQSDFVNEIHKGNQRMVDLVNSLLNVSRLELGTFMIEPKPTNITNICESVLNELLVNITKKQIKITKNYEDGLPIIDVDPRLTRIIFQNLLSNAVKYTPDKGKVSVTLKKDKKNFIISVADTGYGIPDSQKDKIFDKLFRADNIKTKDVEGTGLGLYLVKSILDSSGGHISFTSVENKGTEFIATIPLGGMKKKKGEKTLN